jgi:uncharacterized protein YjbJ (UPF0337 family)
MNRERIEGRLARVKGFAKSKWSKLTADDLKNLSQRKSAFVAKLQDRCGLLKDEAERQVDEWLAKLPSRHS